MSKLDGKWNIVVKTYMGDMPSVAEFKEEGGALTGTVTDSGNGNSAPVVDGVVDGDSFSYKVTLRVPIGDVTNELSGVIDAAGTALSGTSRNAMGEFPFEATRV